MQQEKAGAPRVMLYQRKFNVKSSKTGRRMNRRRLCWSSVSLPRRWRAPAVAGRSVAVSRGSSWTNALRTAAAAAPAAARWAATNNSRSARQRRLVMETRNQTRRFYRNTSQQRDAV